MIQIGIDLGTTNTRVAMGMQSLRVSQEGEGCTFLPSVVAFPPTGNTLVGAAARRRRVIDPENTIVSAKRVIGRNSTAADVRSFAGDTRSSS